MEDVKIRDFMFELNDEVHLPNDIINDAIGKFGANGISFRREVKPLVEHGTLAFIDIDQRLHKPITNYFQALSAGASRYAVDEGASVSRHALEEAKKGVGSVSSPPKRDERLDQQMESEIENLTGNKRTTGDSGLVLANQSSMTTMKEMKTEKKRRTDCVFCCNAIEMRVNLSCGHAACAKCLHDTVVKATREKKGIPIKCTKCKKELPPGDLQKALYPHEFDAYNTALLQALILNDKSMVECIGENCKNVFEVVEQDNLKPPKNILEVDLQGNPISVEAWKHYKQYRLRCKECNAIFCASCKESPYHMGFTCKGFIEYKNSKQCRYCATQITVENMHKVPSLDALNRMSIQNMITFLCGHGYTRAQVRSLRERPAVLREAKEIHQLYTKGAFAEICEGEECKEKRALACPEILECGHPCGGIHLDFKDRHLPCMVCTPALDPEEFCPVCYVEGLKDAPCIQSRGKCRHIFHLKCVTDRINAGYNGARINFKFITCPLCNNKIDHPALKKALTPWLRLERKIQAKALERLKYEKRENDPKIASSYNGNAVEFAMHEYLFYKCFKCKQPYFAGNYACQAADDGKFDPAELLCAGCQPSNDVSNCPKHGTEWIAFKCRFCCNTAQWYCWNKTHFCGKCHKPRVWQTLVTHRKGTNKKKIWEYSQCAGLVKGINKIRNDPTLTESQKMEALKKLRSDPRTCPLKRRHPPNGFEFGLGCTMCADKHIEADNKAATEKASARRR
mmetsp:Transcript_15848/g.39062  ORF Transcript_15848/g.39062 Transcript_15848/m.39062 type:complete len:739 (-) Transcript_15848:199-2415(-)